MTPNREDHLEYVHELGETRTKITNKRIAELVKVSTLTVSEMVRKIIARNLIAKDKELDYYPTEKGLLLVSELYRKHYLIEVFLADHLHYGADEVYQEAEVLRHTVSTILIDRLEENLNFPILHPHDGAVLEKGDFLVEIRHQTLSQIETLGTYKVSYTHDEIHLLNYLRKHELAINNVIELVKVDDYVETYTFIYRSRRLVIPERIAEQIYVRRVD